MRQAQEILERLQQPILVQPGGPVGVEGLELLPVELRIRLSDPLERESGREFFERERLALITRIPAEQGDEVDDGFG